MQPTFDAFIRERTYLSNVSPATIEWYRRTFAWLKVETPTEAELKACVIAMREAGLRATSVNSRIRCINAYLRWSGSAIKVPKLREEQSIPPTFSEADIAKIAHYKPTRYTQQRVQMLVLLLVDTGCRVSEVLTLRWQAVDFDNLCVKVLGKGRKERIVPMSYEARRYLWRYRQVSRFDLVFTTKDGMALTQRNVHHAVTLLCRHLGVTPPRRLLHALRHTFATLYLRRGGNVLYLRQALGHTSLHVTKLYAHVLTEDVARVHQQVSPLAGL